jgi:4-amino-4-deoxy-L-arabinose transferase-like glycosyltransferase
VINIDALLLTFTLLAFLALLAAIKRGTPALSFLSGLLLGASVLTKETAFANLPLGLIAVLLLDWPLRSALWHYLGVVLACLPWWIWRLSATGEMYLLDRLPDPLQPPVTAAAAILLCLAAAAYAFGIVDRFLAEERRRRWVGRIMVVAWTISLSVLMLATTGPPLAEASPETVGSYLARILAPAAVVAPMLLLTAGYAVWRALGRDGPWRVLALALLFQIPICLFVVVMGWDPRQFLVAQALLFCALASLVADAGEAAWRGRDHRTRLAGAAVAVTPPCKGCKECFPKIPRTRYPSDTGWRPRRQR